MFDRCGGQTCAGSNLAPICKFDASGAPKANFGTGMFNFPHGLYVDTSGNVWVTDGRGEDRGPHGHQISPDGKVLMTLGKPGVAGDGPDISTHPSDVMVAPNGDIFVADGHGGKTNARIVKFDKDGKFINAWGKEGTGAGRVRRAAFAGASIRPDVCSSPTAPTAASRSSIRTAISSPSGSSSAGRAALHRQERHALRGRLAVERQDSIPASSRASGSAAPRTAR